jgi:glucose-6-phosphate isomerase
MLKIRLDGRLQQFLKDYEVDLENHHHDIMLKLEGLSHEIPYLEENDFPRPTHYSKIATKIREQNEFIAVVGMGGSALVPEMLYHLLPKKGKAPKLVFFNTPDPIDFAAKMQELELRKTFVIVLSKTGSTIETHMMAQRLMVKIRNEGLDTSRKFLFIIGDKDSSIKQLAQSIQAPMLPYGSKISGRFSAFNEACLILVEAMGADGNAYLDGGKKIIKSIKEDKTLASPYQSAIALFNAYQKGVHASALMSYGEKFRAFNNWYLQLISESLCKNKKGIFPIVATGPQFHHDILQLILDGPELTFNTILHYAEDTIPEGPLEVLFSKQKDNINTLLQNQGKGYRFIEIGTIDETNIGKLVMHFIFEVILLGILLGIRPTGQPAIEKAKLELRELVRK